MRLLFLITYLLSHSRTRRSWIYLNSLCLASNGLGSRFSSSTSFRAQRGRFYSVAKWQVVFTRWGFGLGITDPRKTTSRKYCFPVLDMVRSKSGAAFISAYPAIPIANSTLQSDRHVPVDAMIVWSKGNGIAK